MTGLFLLSVLAVWCVIAYWVAKTITTKLPVRWRSMLARVSLFVALLPLPLADEIVGKFQFNRLCQENSTIQVEAKASGKTVYLTDVPDIQIQGACLPIRLQPWRYVDLTTGEPVISYNFVHATGGRLIRMLGISEGNVPLTFRSYCKPREDFSQVKLFKELGITEIRRPENNIGEKK